MASSSSHDDISDRVASPRRSIESRASLSSREDDSDSVETPSRSSDSRSSSSSEDDENNYLNNLRQAVFECYEDHDAKWKTVAREYGLNVSTLRRAYKSWSLVSEAQVRSW